jgi:hypothetical protein
MFVYLVAGVQSNIKGVIPLIGIDQEKGLFNNIFNNGKGLKKDLSRNNRKYVKF